MSPQALAHQAKYGITEAIVREPLPLGGGFGFRRAVYCHGVELPNGVHGVVDAINAQREAAGSPPQNPRFSPAWQCAPAARRFPV